MLERGCALWQRASPPVIKSGYDACARNTCYFEFNGKAILCQPLPHMKTTRPHQSDEADNNQIYRNDVVQQSWCDQNENASNQGYQWCEV